MAVAKDTPLSIFGRAGFKEGQGLGLQADIHQLNPTLIFGRGQSGSKNLTHACCQAN